MDYDTLVCFPVEQVIGGPGPKRTKIMTEKHKESVTCKISSNMIAYSDGKD